MSDMIGAAEVLIGAVGLVTAILIYQWQRNCKGLGVAVLTDRPLLMTPSPFAVSVHHDGKVVGEPRLIVLRIANTGNVPIEASDFERPLSITFPYCEVLSAEVTGVRPAELTATLRTDGPTITLDPCLLNPADLIEVQYLLDGSDDLQVECRVGRGAVRREGESPEGLVGQGVARVYRRCSDAEPWTHGSHRSCCRPIPRRRRRQCLCGDRSSDWRDALVLDRSPDNPPEPTLAGASATTGALACHRDDDQDDTEPGTKPPGPGNATGGMGEACRRPAPSCPCVEGAGRLFSTPSRPALRAAACGGRPRPAAPTEGVAVVDSVAVSSRLIGTAIVRPGGSVNQSSNELQYDVCLSFAGENRGYVADVADALKRSGIRVFYDDYEQVTLWGKDLYVHLDWVYQRAARYCVLFASKEYAKKVWTNHERISAQARAIEENKEYILPVRFDNTEIPGLRKTISYIDLQDVSPETLAALIVQKVGPQVRRSFLPPRPDRLFDALDLDEEKEQDEAYLHASAFLQTLNRMTEEERPLIFAIFLNGCPEELPENIHISLDLLRHITGLAPSEAISELQQLSSFGFEHEVRSDEEHNETVVLRWNDFLSLTTNLS